MSGFIGRSWFAVVLGFLAGGVVGCGGGGGGRDTPPPLDPGVAEDVSTVPDVPATDPGGGDTGPVEDPGKEGAGDAIQDGYLPDPGPEPGMPDPGPEQGTMDPGPEPFEEVIPDVPGDVACQPPSFSEDCSLVTEFQCGFQAWCEAGVLHADWHHHWFCDGEEEITPFQCSYPCPHGCEEGPIMDWPANGQALVEGSCSLCSQPSDCEGLDHPMCVGYWQCEKGACSWVCDGECVGEGGSVPVVPGAPECCPGLVKVPCDKPDEHGECSMCVGASLCTYCGDGECGTGENLCNCPSDCDGECLGLGGTFLDFNTAGKCCPGLKPVPDCDIGPGDGCSCPKCPCYICLPCGDGVCGPFEHVCNCAEDCPEAEKCVSTKKSECLGDPYGSDPAGTLKVEVTTHDITLHHEAVVLNCCLETTVCFTPRPGSIEVVERQGGGPPCFCQCLFDIVATLPGIESGTYDLTLYNEEQAKLLFEETVVVP